jgi:HSP20 family protein
VVWPGHVFHADSFVVEAALPGVKPEDVSVTVLGDILTISSNTAGEQTREDEGYSYREIRRGSYHPDGDSAQRLKTDAATATFENGLLRLSFPKAEEAKPRQIEITPQPKARRPRSRPRTIRARMAAEHRARLRAGQLTTND